MLKDEYKSYEAKMQKSIDSVASDFAAVRAGRANASVLDSGRTQALMYRIFSTDITPIPHHYSIAFRKCLAKFFRKEYNGR